MSNYCYNCMMEIADGQTCPVCNNKQRYESAPHHLSPGQVLNGRFLVGNCIGEGGFGITYVGRDLVLDIKVAIKEYFPNGYVNRNNSVTQNVTATTQSQKEFFQKGKVRFLEEAKNVAKFVDEPGIVSIREYFESNGTAYIIMEYLDGVNLSRHIKQNGAMDSETIFRLMLPLVYSIKKVHEAGIIHRDISPDNIMYMTNGTLKLMDFGSARYFTNEEKEMSIMLKHGYSPEEQYRKNGDQGPWTDVYGLCATIYRCITGIVPEDALDRVRQDTVRMPSELGVRITESLQSVLMYGLAVFKENRCQSMGEMHKLIIKALQNPQAVPVPVAQQNTRITRAMTEDSEYRTQAADAPPLSQSQVVNQPDTDKTVSVAAPAFGAHMPANAPVNRPQGAVMYGNNNTAVAANNKKSNNTKIVVTIVAVIVAIAMLIGAGFLIGSMINNSKDDSDDDDNKSGSVTIKDKDEEETEAQTEKETEKLVVVPDCEDRKCSDVQKELEKLGLKVKINYIFSDIVEKDYVISQSLSDGTEVNEGSEITITVSKGSSECPNDYEQKLVVTASSGSSRGTATFYEWQDGEYKKIKTYNCTVGSQGIGSASEGRSVTPSGIHDLGVVISQYSIDTNMDIYGATPYTGVVYDTSSSYYNRIMEKSAVPNGTKFDQIGQGLTDGTTYATIYIEHNGSGFSSSGVVKGKGSAIGLRGQYGPLTATYGDVDISSDDMIDLLSRLDYFKNPVIEIKVK